MALSRVVVVVVVALEATPRAAALEDNDKNPIEK